MGASTDLATVSIKGDTLQDTLTLASTKGILLTQFGAGTHGDVYLRPNLATGLVSICDNSTSKILIGATAASGAFQTTIGGDTIF